MKKLSLFFAVLFCYHLSSSQIGITANANISPAEPTANDSVTINVHTYYHDLLFLYDTSLSIYNDTIFLSACHLYGSTPDQPPTADSVRILLGTLPAGIWVFKYIARGTNTLNDSSCQHFDQTDTVIKTFVVGVSAIDEVKSDTFELQLFSGVTNNTILLSPSSSAVISSCNITLYNILGQRIRKEYTGLVSGQLKVQAFTGDLAPGFYFYEVQVGEERKALRFVKE
jgi:AAA+ ATPase superfamily predicted ATPase